MKIYMSFEAKKGVSSILKYLRNNFGIKNEKEFYNDFQNLINKLLKNPYLGVEHKKGIRKLVISKTLVFYKVELETIYIIYVIDSRVNFRP